MSVAESTFKSIYTFIKDLKFGEIVIKVQDGCVVSVERHEKIRLAKTADSSKSGEAKFNN